MPFKTVFDAAHEGYSSWAFPAFGLIFVCAGALLVFRPPLRWKTFSHGPLGVLRKAFSWFFLIFAVLWTLAAFVLTYAEYRKAESALRDGNYKVVEGTVTNFVPMPYAGHSQESFMVDGRRFSYSDYIVTAGFHNTASHGGPIKEGLHVRITYSDNLILRLEVAE